MPKKHHSSRVATETIKHKPVSCTVKKSLVSAAIISHLGGFDLGHAAPPLPSPFELSSLDGHAGIIINGINPGDFSATSISNAGDFNGDGLDDVIIGAPLADPLFIGDGQSYVLFGSTGAFQAIQELNELDGTNGVIINPPSFFVRFGTSVSDAGDFNGDGLDDIMIGAPDASPNGFDSGQTIVVFGRTSGFNAVLPSNQLGINGGVFINGINEYDYSGAAVSNAGDFNGDGIDDVIIGARAADPNGTISGQAYIVFGQSGVLPSILELSDLDGSNGLIINGTEAGDYLGFTVSNAGDINADGFDDVMVAAFNDSSPPLDGQIYVIYGTSDVLSSPLEISDLDNDLALTINNTVNSRLSISAAGDINGDNVDDVLVGTPETLPRDVSPGNSYLIFGNSNGFDAAITLTSLNGSNGIIIRGISDGDSSGFSVSRAGDFNNDGIDDLLIGARGADPNGIASGQAYVVYGSQQGLASPLDLSSLNGENGVIFNGLFPLNSTGASISSAGDFNGDGRDDLFIGAPNTDPDNIPGLSGSGQSYIVFGGLFSTFEVPTLNRWSYGFLAGLLALLGWRVRFQARQE